LLRPVPGASGNAEEQFSGQQGFDQRGSNRQDDCASRLPISSPCSCVDARLSGRGPRISTTEYFTLHCISLSRPSALGPSHTRVSAADSE
jgi:hypothetical protein